MFKTNAKEHYKMYKQGKTWIFASIVSATLALGVTSTQTAQADTETSGESAQEATTKQSVTPEKEVVLNTNTATTEEPMVTVDESIPAPVAEAPAEVADEQQSTESTEPVTEQPQNESAATNDNAKDATPETTVTDNATTDTTVTTTATAATDTAPTESVAVTPDKVTPPTAAEVAEQAVKAAIPTSQRKVRALSPMPAPAVIAAQAITDVVETIDQWMPNKTLQKAILTKLNKGNFGKTWDSVDDITKEDMLLFESLSFQDTRMFIDGQSEFSLEGLQYATNLKKLDLLNSLNLSPTSMRGDVVDITPLASLKNLEYLQLTSQRVSDVTPLAGLTKLTELNLANNCIADFSSLNSAQYTGYFSYTGQLVERPVVYVPVTGKYSMPNQVKAPQGMTFNYGGSAGRAIPVVPATASNPLVRLFYNAGTSVRNGDQIDFQVVNNQIMPGPTQSPYPEYPVVQQNPYTYYLISIYTDANGSEVADVFTPYIVADYAEDVTVNYVDQNNQKLADAETLKGLLGEPYTAVAKEIDGYHLTETPANATGEFTDEPQQVTFVYAKDEETVTPPVVTPPEQTITVTVHYQTADGTTVAPDVTITGKTGDAYTTSPATDVPDGYELVTTPANASGTFGDSDSTVTYIYAETGGDADKVTPDTTEPDKVTPDKPKTPGKEIETGGQADKVVAKPVVLKQETKGSGTATVAKTALADKTPAKQASAQAMLPQTDTARTSPLWGLALLSLVSVLGLVGGLFRKKQQ